MAHGIWQFFSRREFACRCGCGFASLDVELADVLLDLRLYVDEPVFINSGCRCYKHNKAEGGAENSTHLYALAVDVRAQTMSADRVAEYLERRYPTKYGIGRYIGRTHIDTKPGPPRRWDKR